MFGRTKKQQYAWDLAVIGTRYREHTPMVKYTRKGSAKIRYVDSQIGEVYGHLVRLFLLVWSVLAVALFAITILYSQITVMAGSMRLYGITAMWTAYAVIWFAAWIAEFPLMHPEQLLEMRGYHPVSNTQWQDNREVLPDGTVKKNAHIRIKACSHCKREFVYGGKMCPFCGIRVGYREKKKINIPRLRYVEKDSE